MTNYVVTITVDGGSIDYVVDRAINTIVDEMDDMELPSCHEVREIIAKKILEKIKEMG